ncbi:MULTISPECIES: hypothetical protein [Chitinophagaceae]
MKLFRKIFQLMILNGIVFWAHAQNAYTVENAHSHNDYKQAHPFVTAYNAAFGSIEADVYLVNGALLVAHSEDELGIDRTLEKMYLQPLAQHIKENKGFPYKDHSRKLQLLVELKSEPSREILAMDSIFHLFPNIRNNKNIQVVFTGRTPSVDTILQTPSYMYFDVEPGRQYTSDVWKKVTMVSSDFHRYTKWNGIGTIPDADFQKLKNIVDQYHKLGKKVRFWDTPDNMTTWVLMKKLQVDYINTDHIDSLAQFLNVK